VNHKPDHDRDISHGSHAPGHVVAAHNLDEGAPDKPRILIQQALFLQLKYRQDKM
jgi:hypothetical protein